MIVCNEDMIASSHQKPIIHNRGPVVRYSYLQHIQEPPQPEAAATITARGGVSSPPVRPIPVQSNSYHQQQQHHHLIRAAPHNHPHQHQHQHQHHRHPHPHPHPAGGNYKNQEAIQELEQDLGMVISQRQRQQLQQQQQHFQPPQSSPEPLPSPPRSAGPGPGPGRQQQQQQEKLKTVLEAYTSSSSTSSSSYQRDQRGMDADQAKMLAQYQHFFGPSQHPSTNTPCPSTSTTKEEEEEEKESLDNATNKNDSGSGSGSKSNDNTNNNDDSKRLSTSPSSHSLSSLTPSSSSPNDRSLSPMSRLFALGSEVQPLVATSCSTTNQHRRHHDHDPTKPLPLSSSNGHVSLTDNDLMMNTLFHSELKMSRTDDEKDKKTESDEPAILNKQTIEQKPDQNRSKVTTRSRIPRKISGEAEELSQTKTTPPNKKMKILPSQQKKLAEQEGKGGRGGPIKRKLRRPGTQQKKRRMKKSKGGDEQEEDTSIEEQILTLPATIMAPSVLASIVMGEQQQNHHHPHHHHQEQKPLTTVRDGEGNGVVVQDDINNSSAEEAHQVVSPSKTFQDILKRNGYDKMYSIDTEETEYDAVPSPLQLASYGTYLVWAVQTSNIELLGKLLDCGLSPNPCNQFRDTILGDLVCKQSNVPIYRCLVDKFNADIQVVDGFGRAPLHHCCWSHNLCKEIATDILQRDPAQIFLKDKHGKTPLDYVRPDTYEDWNNFLLDVADTYWPVDGELPNLISPRDRQPNGDQVDPPDALSPLLAASVSSGLITPEDAIANMKSDDAVPTVTGSK